MHPLKEGGLQGEELVEPWRVTGQPLANCHHHSMDAFDVANALKAIPIRKHKGEKVLI